MDFLLHLDALSTGMKIISQSEVHGTFFFSVAPLTNEKYSNIFAAPLPYSKNELKISILNG